MIATYRHRLNTARPHCLPALILMLCLAPTASSQQMPDRYGGYFHIVFNNYKALFSGLPGVPSCCPTYEDGGGTGFATGLLYEHPFAQQLMYQLRLGVADLGGSFKTDEPFMASVEGVATPGLLRHTIDAKLWALEFSPLLVYKPYPKFSFLFGGIGAYLFQKRYEQKETLIQPDIGVFENGLRERNVFEGDIPNVNALQFSLAVGARYDFPFDERRRWWGAMEFFYTFGLTQAVRSLDWRINTVRLGVALMYAGDVPPALEAPPIPSTGRRKGTEPKDPPRDSRQTTTSDTPAAADAPGVANASLRCETISVDHLRPLLNYVFFDHERSTIDARYAALTRESAKRFSINDLHRSGTLEVYYQLLNIVGKRMNDYPDATVTLVGCNSNTAEERDNQQLSRSRALAVRDYLSSVWGIDTARLAVQARNLPEHSAYASDSDGIAENRRVEIQSTEWNILAPVETEETVRLFEPGTLRCALPAATAARWTLTIRDGNDEVFRSRGNGMPPSTFEIPSKDITLGASTVDRTLKMSLTLAQASGDTRTIEAGNIAVHTMSSADARFESRGGRRMQRFNLILFDFDSPALNAYHRRVIDIIHNRMITPASIHITGYTDRMGEADYNLRLSGGRARSAAEALGEKGIKNEGLGETRMFDNDLPEGRCYNRTVEVEVMSVEQ
jgi:outer membrane protein OmpA-like peptidoglycan-associated protein